MKDLAPIALFTYNRLCETKQTIQALEKNFLAKESLLYVFSDGGKKEKDIKLVSEVRQYLKSVNGFKDIILFEAKENKGLAYSIINGVTEVICKHGKIIVLEDDLITSANFLDYMNQALNFYKNNEKIISISGYTLNLPNLKNYSEDYYIGLRASSWGWATWLDKWDATDWEVNDYKDFVKSLKKRKDFYNIGTDMPKMLKNQMEGKIDSWAIRWCYHQFKNELWTVFSSKSKVNSIGINENATHTKGVTKFITPMDDGKKREFLFDEKPSINHILINDFKSFFSIQKRILDKIKRPFKNLKL